MTIKAGPRAFIVMILFWFCFSGQIIRIIKQIIGINIQSLETAASLFFSEILLEL